MRVTYIGHATALIEAGGVRLITDPVFSEPLYCNTLWHYPPLAVGIADLPPLDFIYISHHHADHFDPASLAQFDKSAALIVPALDEGWAPLNAPMQRERFHRSVRRLGFKTVHMLRAWETLELAPEVWAVMVPAATLDPDSSLVVQTGGRTVFVQNDNYLGDRVCADLASRFPTIDLGLMFCGASIGYPAVADLPDDVRVREARRRKYEHFFPKARYYVEALRPRLFVPFANDLSWLAPEDVWINRLCRVHPAEFLAYLEAHPLEGVTPVLMQSRDYWTPEDGVVRCAPPPDGSRFFEELEAYARAKRPAVAQLRAGERSLDTTGLAELFIRRMRRAAEASDGAVRDVGRLTVHMSVQGRVPDEFTLTFRDGMCSVERGTPRGTWDLRITIDDFLLMGALRGKLEFQEIRNSRWRISHPGGYTEAMRRFWLWLCVHVDPYLAAIAEKEDVPDGGVGGVGDD
ncbi:MAG TPA: MBL fold metallo-hydrolase [Candidatus Binatia bacterium]|nr:MBL fold metallo-hydrolase [Candidatus Binatia bacterium]